MSYVTPKINTAYVFYASLEDKANPGLFKASPTLANGDVLVATGDGAPGNITTLPVVDADFTKRVKVSLSAGEMNGDNVTVIFSDAAGAEWYDLLINIQTTARQIDDLAYPTVSGNSLDVSATGEAGLDFANVKAATAPTTLTNITLPTVTTLTNMPAAAPSAATIAAEILVTPANKLATGAAGVASVNVTTLKGETEPVDNLVLALGTGGLVEKLNSMLEAAGLAYRFTAEALAESPTEAGAGTGTYTDTITDGTNPLDGARVQLSTDAAGAHRVYEAFTNALGVFVMNPDPGTYYRWIDLAGYTDRLTQGAQVTVT